MKRSKIILYGGILTCLSLLMSCAMPVVATEKTISESEVTLWVDKLYVIKATCPEHASMYIDDAGPYSPGQLETRTILSGKEISISFVPDKGYRISDFKYGSDMDVTISGNSIVLSNIKSDAEISAFIERIGASNPITLDESQFNIWCGILVLSGLGVFVLIKLRKSIIRS